MSHTLSPHATVYRGAHTRHTQTQQWTAGLHIAGRSLVLVRHLACASLPARLFARAPFASSRSAEHKGAGLVNLGPDCHLACLS